MPSSPDASRPPSAPPGSSGRKTSSNQGTADEDLPPRIEKGDPPPYPDGHTPGDIEPNGEAAVSEAELPKHAGFDLGAMKKLIENAELHPAELQVQDPGQYAVPPIPPPASRSESAPPLHDSPVMTSLRLPTPQPESNVGPSSTDLHAGFQRSVSLHEGSEVKATHSQPYQTILQEGIASGPSALPSANGFDSSWAAESAAKSNARAFGSQSLGSSTNVLPLGNHNGSTTPSGTSYGLPPNPFTDLPPPSVGLSFGGADGSITSSAEAERDPWNARSPQTKVSGFSSNPWQS